MIEKKRNTGLGSVCFQLGVSKESLDPKFHMRELGPVRIYGSLGRHRIRESEKCLVSDKSENQ